MTEHNLTNAELSILALIAEKPRHGYELEQVIEERGMRAWTEVAFSSIYFILKGLVKKGLASSVLQQASGRGPAKKVFSATPPGHATLHEGIRQAISGAEQDRQTFLLGLSCLPLLTKKEAEVALHHRMLFLTEKVNELSTHPALTQSGFPPHVRAMFEYSLTLVRADLDWCRAFNKSYPTGEIQNG
jgi:DNA-binding PadR family transcriptional regulator